MNYSSLSRKLLLLSLWGGAGFGAAAVELSRGGEALLPIRISTTADATVRYAASELQSALKRLTGADFALELADGNENTPAIRILVEPGADWGNDGFMIVAGADALELRGSSSRAALYAVYAFLNDFGGIEWLWPGADGEFLTRKPDFSVPGTAVRGEAAFRYRGFHLCHVHIDPETETWMARNRLNLMRSPAPDAPWVKELLEQRRAKGLYVMVSGHNIILDEETFRSNPELFAVIEGRRTKEQLCWSNPETFRRIAEQLGAWLAGAPEIEIVSLFPADNVEYCRCPACAESDVSDAWFGFYNRLVQALQPRFPGVRFATIAYSGYGTPPRFGLEESEFVEYCMYNRCYVHTFDTPDCAINAQALTALEAWRQTGVPLMVYGYEFDIFNRAMHVPFYAMLADEMRRFRDLGAIGVFPETLPLHYRPDGAEPGRLPYHRNRLAYYLYAKLLWNPDLDWREEVRQFADTAFDAAAAPMTEYFLVLADAWEAMKIHYSYYGASPLGAGEVFLSDDTLGRALELLARARSEAAAIADAAVRDRVLREIGVEAEVLQLWRSVRDSARSSRGNAKIVVPRVADPEDFSGAAELPPFQTDSEIPVPDTTARIQYTDRALYFDIVCGDPAPEFRSALRTEHDSDVWADEALEIFIGVPNDPEGIYRHFAVNRLGTGYDAVVVAGGVYNVAGFNPAWQVQVEDAGARWHARIVIPFEALGRRPEAKDTWQFTIKRSPGGRRDLPYSGFPDACYHDLNSFGVLQFSAAERVTKLTLVTPKTEQKVLDWLVELGRAGFQIRTAATWEEAGADRVIVIPHTGKPLSGDTKVLKWKLEDGALVVFTGYGALPLEQWFGDPSMALQWSGWEVGADRRTVTVLPGQWSTAPADLTESIRTLMSPSNGYRPAMPGAWMALATLQMQDGSEMPYLLARRVGRGLLVVTGADFGFGGGYVFLGSDTIHTVPMLLDNLRHNFID